MTFSRVDEKIYSGFYITNFCEVFTVDFSENLREYLFCLKKKIFEEDF